MDSVIPQNFKKNEKKMLYLLFYRPKLVCPHQGQLANHLLGAHPITASTTPVPAGLPHLAWALGSCLVFQPLTSLHRLSHLAWGFVFHISLKLWLRVENRKCFELYLQLETHQPLAISGGSCLPELMGMVEWDSEV